MPESDCYGIILLGLFLISCTGNPISDDPNKPDPGDFQVRDVLINEFMVLQESTISDPDFGLYGSWIEFINREDDEVNISDWVVTGSRNEMQYTLPQGTVIPGNSFLLIWADGRNTVEDAIHANFILQPDDGFIGLYGPEWSEYKTIDTLTYFSHEIQPDISWGRVNLGERDNTGFFLPLNRPTPGAANELVSLQMLDEFDLDISDPSGLAPDHSGNYLWTISDDPGGSIYKITLTGDIADELEVEGHDMEGIVQDFKDFTLWVAEEKLREIVQYDTSGNELRRIKVDVEQQKLNDGLEGITLNPHNNHFFVVNEQNPRKLIELDLSRTAGNQQVQYISVNFRGGKEYRGLDLSGLYFEPEDEILWMISDEAASIFQLDQKGRPLAAYYIGKDDLEGITVNKKEGLIYLVSDEHQKLFVYEYPFKHNRLGKR